MSMNSNDVSDEELQRLINQNPATELLSHPRVQDVAVERVLENETFLEKFANEQGLVRKEEFEAAVQALKDSDGNVIQAGFAAGTSDDPDDYGTGVQGADDRPLEDRDELTAEQRENIRTLNRQTQRSEPPEAFGTGVSGDTSREEYEEREKQASAMTEAFRRLGIGDDEK